MAAEHGVTLEWEPLFNDDITQRFRKAFNTYANVPFLRWQG